MLLSTMALIACIGFTGDVICSRITSHLYWLADAVLSFVTFAQLAHDASSLCQFPAYLYATSLGEAWPPFAAGSLHLDGPTVSGHSCGLHFCLLRPLHPASLAYVPTYALHRDAHVASSSMSVFVLVFLGMHSLNSAIAEHLNVAIA